MLYNSFKREVKIATDENMEIDINKKMLNDLSQIEDTFIFSDSDYGSASEKFREIESSITKSAVIIGLCF